MLGIFYPDHDERYAHIPETQRKDYPDEVKRPGCATIKRVKDFADMTMEDWKEYGPDLIRLAAKDIPVSRAVYH